jgi:hypothetical protein
MSTAVSQWVDRVVVKIVDTTIVLLEQSPADAKYAAAGVDNLWEECCLQLNRRGGLASVGRIGPFRDALREVVLSVDRDDLLDLWLRTPKGKKFLSTSKGKYARAATLPANALEEVVLFLLVHLDRRANEYDSASLIRYRRILREKEDRRDRRESNAHRKGRPQAITPKPDEPAENYFDRLVLMLIAEVSESRADNRPACEEVPSNLGRIPLKNDLDGLDSDTKTAATAVAKELAARIPVRGVIAIWLLTGEGQIWKTSGAHFDQSALDPESLLRNCVSEFLADTVVSVMKKCPEPEKAACGVTICVTQNAPSLHATFDMSKEDSFVVKVATSIATKLQNRRQTSFEDALMLGICISAMRRLPSRIDEADFALEIYSNRERAGINFRLTKSSFEIVRRRVGLSGGTMDSGSEVLVWQFGNKGECYRGDSPYGLRAEVEWLWSGEERFRVQIS